MLKITIKNENELREYYDTEFNAKRKHFPAYDSLNIWLKHDLEQSVNFAMWKREKAQIKLKEELRKEFSHQIKTLSKLFRFFSQKPK